MLSTDSLLVLGRQLATSPAAPGHYNFRIWCKGKGERKEQSELTKYGSLCVLDGLASCMYFVHSQLFDAHGMERVTKGAPKLVSESRAIMGNKQKAATKWDCHRPIHPSSYGKLRQKNPFG